MTFQVLALIFLAMAFYGCGEYFSKLYANNPAAKIAWTAVCFYVVNAVIFLIAIERWNKLAILGTVWSIACMMTTLLIAVSIFNEPVTLSQKIGILLGVVSIALLSIS